VVYKQNGTVFYTSAVPSTGNLIADAALYHGSAQIDNARMFGVSGFAVDWTDQVGVAVDGSTLTKTDVTGWSNSGAASVQTIADDGAVEFEAVDTSSRRIVGLSNSNTNADYNTIDYAIYISHLGSLQVYESGVKIDNFGTYQSGDILRVERIGSTVVYKQNGTIFYTSEVSSTGGLIADVALYDATAKVENIRMHGSN